MCLVRRDSRRLNSPWSQEVWEFGTSGFYSGTLCSLRGHAPSPPTQTIPPLTTDGIEPQWAFLSRHAKSTKGNIASGFSGPRNHWSGWIQQLQNSLAFTKTKMQTTENDFSIRLHGHHNFLINSRNSTHKSPFPILTNWANINKGRWKVPIYFIVFLLPFHLSEYFLEPAIWFKHVFFRSD